MTESGLILIDKPAGVTSHFVVSKVKRLLKAERVGHLGTLDPFATGLLPIMLGGATRLADEIMEGNKRYLFTIQLGKETDTLDTAGRVIDEQPVPEDFAVRVASALSQFSGAIEQVPPVYSALKMQGRPLYEHMRATGKLPADIETKKRSITVHSIELVEVEEVGNEAFVTIRVVCSKGTYVRSLARDIARAVGTVGFCARLRREYVEPWDVTDALVFGEHIKAEDLRAKIVSPFHMTPHIPRVNFEESYKRPMAAGNYFLVSRLPVEMEVSEQPRLIFACCEEIVYLAELTQHSDKTTLKIQPRKKIV